MHECTLSRFLISFTSLALLVQCSGESSPSGETTGTPTGSGVGASSGVGTNAGVQTTGEQSASGSGSGGNSQTTSTTASGAESTSGSPTASSGTTGAASGSGNTVGGATTAGTTTGGAGGNGSTTASTGSGGTGGTGPDVDQNGKSNAAPGESTDVPQDYLRLGEIRILNNNWGSEDLGCSAPTSTMSVFVNEGGSFGWNFDRGDCAPAMDSSHPDFPQVEFGIHPFGIGSDLQTSPPFSSTTLLPTQLKNITSVSISLDQLNLALQNQTTWNLSMEFWLSERDPVNDPNPGVYAEIMAWWGWQNGRWPCDLNNDGMVDYGDSVQAGAMQYTLCHQDDNWASGWRYYQFRAGDGSDGNIRTNFNGSIDVKAFIDYLVNNRGYSQELWLTRLEIGSEIDDNTSGTVSTNGVTFEVNGETRSQVIASP